MDETHRRTIVVSDSAWRTAKSEAALAGITISDYIEGLIGRAWEHEFADDIIEQLNSNMTSDQDAALKRWNEAKDRKLSGVRIRE